MKEIDVFQLKEKRDNKESFLLLDVRDEHEQYISSIGGTLIPLDQLQVRLSEIVNHKDSEVIVMCRSGNRSSEACKLLEKNGFTNVLNLKGGINEWSKNIDSSLPVY